MISATTAIGFGAVLAGVIAGWNQVKGYLLQVYGIFVHRACLDWYAARMLRLYLYKHAIWQTSSTKFFWTKTSAIRGEVTPLSLLYKTFHEDFNHIYVVRGGPVIMLKGSVVCPRTVNLDKLLCLALAEANDQARSNGDTQHYILYRSGNRFTYKKAGNTDTVKATEPSAPNDEKSSRLLNFKEEDIGTAVIPFMDNLYLTPEMHSAVNDAEQWYNSRLWYEKHNIRWKRGWLLYGKPGCGKTRFIEAIAQKIRLPVMVFDLASMTNEDFRREIDAFINVPRILLFEDFDTVFEGRTNITNTEMNPGLTFDCFLNGIDGMDAHTGAFTIITTNRIDCIDSAIAGVVDNVGGTTRPGRVDRVFELTDLPKEGLEWMANKILSDFPRDRWEDLLSMQNQTGAQFQEKCCRRAMDLYWATHKIEEGSYAKSK